MVSVVIIITCNFFSISENFRQFSIFTLLLLNIFSTCDCKYQVIQKKNPGVTVNNQVIYRLFSLFIQIWYFPFPFQNFWRPKFYFFHVFSYFFFNSNILSFNFLDPSCHASNSRSFHVNSIFVNSYKFLIARKNVNANYKIVI